MPGSKTEYNYLSGKAKWPKLNVPDKYGKWAIVLYPDSDGVAQIQEWIKRGLKNELKKDEDGYYMTFSRPQQKEYNGKVKGFAPPEVIGPDDKPFRDLIGNGSDVTLKLECYSFRDNKGYAARLGSVRVDNLIPYIVNRDFNPEQQKVLTGLIEQPKPLWN